MNPPRLAQRLLSRILRDDVRGASIRGDLYEEFNFRANEKTPASARRWYWRQTLAIAARELLPGRSETFISDRSFSRASLMDSLILDLKIAVRSLLHARGFAVMAIITLALGIGASTAVFSIVDAVLRRPLWFADPARVMWMMETRSDGARMSVAWPNYLDWRARQTSFADIAAVLPNTLTLTGTGEPERVVGRWITWNFFDVLGVQPAIGRAIAETEDRAGGRRVVVISDGFWHRRFNGDTAVLGKSIVIDGEPCEIIGVLPPKFRYNPATDDQVFVSLGQRAVPSSGFLDRGNHNGLSVIGRLRPGVTESTARDELKNIAAALTREYPNTNADVRTELMPVTERLVGEVAPTLKMLFGAVAFLLVLGTVNIANLLVTRAVSRRHELAIRSALGCGRWRLAGQFMMESVVLTLTGAVAGLAVAATLIRLLVAAAPPDLPRLDEVTINATAAAFAIVCSIVAAAIFGIVTALQSSGVTGQEALVRTGRGDTGAVSAQRIRRVLMVVEVAIALVLLSGAGLMVRTVQAVTSVDPGFDPKNLLTMRFNVNLPGPAQNFGEKLTVMHDELLSKLNALPGVESTALTYSLPIEGSQWGSVFIVSDRPVPARTELPNAAFIPVTAGYFETMRMSLRAGRFFDGSEKAGTTDVVIVNTAFASHFWPNGNAIGQRLKQGWPEDAVPWRTIVGVVNDVKLNGVDQTTPMQVYLPMRQHPTSSATIIVRAARSPQSLVKPVATAVHGIDPNLPVYSVQTMDELMSSAVARRRLTMSVLGAFATLALLLAFVGLYGVIAYGVSTRTREIGVRLALGASRTQVTGLFVRQGLVMAGQGLLIGAALALSLAHLIKQLLFQVAPTDPVSLWTAAGLLGAVAVCACYLPARRAARLSPTIALRGE